MNFRGSDGTHYSAKASPGAWLAIALAIRDMKLFSEVASAYYMNKTTKAIFKTYGIHTLSEPFQIQLSDIDFLSIEVNQKNQLKINMLLI